MRRKHLLAILILLALILPAAPAHAGGTVDVCTEARLTEVLAGGGTVTFSCSGTIVLTSTITIATNTALDGSGQSVTLSGGNAVRLFKVNSGVTFSLNALTLIRGSASDSGGSISSGSGSTLIISNTTFFGNTAPTGGGAIYFPGGSLTITDSIFSGNTARLGGAVYAGGGAVGVTGSSFSDNGTASTDGGAIHSSGSTLTVSDCSFDSNSGSEGGAILIQRGTATVMDSSFFNNSAGIAGGALDIFPESVVEVEASTIHENRASSAGGGIYNKASLTLTNSTVWKNLGTTEGGGLANTGGGTATVLNSTIADNGGGAGGGIYNSGGTVTLKNTIVANSSSGGNCSGAVVDGGGNLSYPDATCPGIQGDPVLGSLQDLGGPTQMMPIQPGSAAVDAGSSANCAAEDQRGLARPQGHGCDIGAYEVGYLAVTKTTDDDGECTVTDCALREAILAANARPGPDWIDLPAATYPLTLGAPVPQEDWLRTGDLKIRDALTIAGASASSTIIHQTVNDGVFEVEYVAPGNLRVLLRDLTIENGASPWDGGGILSRGNLTLERCTVRDNTAQHLGGGIASYQTLTLRDSTFSGNVSSWGGGGVYHDAATLTVSGSTFSANSAADDGGGMYNEGLMYMANSTLYGNSAEDEGGAIYNTGPVNILFSTLSGNRAGSGGAIYSGGRQDTYLWLFSSILANSPAGGNCVSPGPGWPTEVISYPDGSCGNRNVDPLLGPLQDNGGPTWTMALGAGSPAIDTGSDDDCAYALVGNRDQRGGHRPTGAHCDVGAYEARAFDTYVQFDGGQAFTCATRIDGAVVCWGRNKEGQATAPAGDFTQVTAGGYHACAIRAGDNKAVCWGSNSIPVKSCVSETCDTVYLDAGQARPPDGAFVRVTAGAYHTCGLKSDGSVDCWGSNINENQKSIGQAQDRAGPFTQVSAGMWHNCAVRKADGIVECWGDTADGKATPPAGVAFTQVAAGANHTCGLKPDGSVACWGGNTWGQAPKERSGPYKEVQAGDLFTCGLLRNGALDCWGYNFYGQTKEPEGVLTTFGLGDAHGCATLDANDQWICWGRNDQGQAPDNPALPPQASDPEDHPPVVQLFLDPAEPDGANDWYYSPVTVEPQASDDTEVAELRCALDPVPPPAAFDDLPEGHCTFLGGAQVTTDGEHTFYAAAADVWGNKSTPVSVGFKIDTPPPGLTSLEVTVNREQAYTGAILEYKLTVRNLTPAEQVFAVTDPIPAHTEIVRRINYNPATNAVEWSGVLEPWGFKTFTVYVRILSGTPGGTAIVNTAAIEDEAATGSASAATIVKTLPPYRGHRADVDVNEVVSRGK